MFDWTYLVFVMPTIILALWAQGMVSSRFNRYSKVASKRNLTGASAARLVLDRHGLHHVKIEHIAGNLSDHFDPRVNIIRLSDSVYNSPSIAAIGVACHEVGHAIQHAEKYSPITIRNTILPVANIGTMAAFPLAFLGIFMNSQIMINFGILLFGAFVLFQIVTLPVEFNASNRAIAELNNSNMLDSDEINGVKKVLGAAAMTYVAAAATAVMNLVRLLLLTNRKRDD